MNMKDRRWCWLSHILRMDEGLAQETLLNYGKPEKESLFSDNPKCNEEKAIETARDGEKWKKIQAIAALLTYLRGPFWIRNMKTGKLSFRNLNLIYRPSGYQSNSVNVLGRTGVQPLLPKAHTREEVRNCLPAHHESSDNKDL